MQSHLTYLECTNCHATYPADEFVADWLDKVRHGRHVAGRDAEGTRLE